MSRDFVINGEVMVKVRGNGALGALVPTGVIRAADSVIPATHELGLAEKDGVTVVPTFRHKDLHCDNFGPDVPVEVMFQLAEVMIRMTLIHYDKTILSSCVNESTGGSGPAGWDGVIPAGALMGNNVAPGFKGNHFITLWLSSPILGVPWRFPTAYIVDQMTIPLGVKRTAVQLTWRAIPYQYGAGERRVSAVHLWDHDDTDFLDEVTEEDLKDVGVQASDDKGGMDVP